MNLDDFNIFKYMSPEVEEVVAVILVMVALAATCIYFTRYVW